MNGCAAALAPDTLLLECVCALNGILLRSLIGFLLLQNAQILVVTK